MKNAQQWTEVKPKNDNKLEHDRYVENIQLDAYKQALTDAAYIANDCLTLEGAATKIRNLRDSDTIMPSTRPAILKSKQFKYGRE